MGKRVSRTKHWYFFILIHFLQFYLQLNAKQIEKQSQLILQAVCKPKTLQNFLLRGFELIEPKNSTIIHLRLFRDRKSSGCVGRVLFIEF